MNVNISVFIFCVEVIIYLLLDNLHDCTFKEQFWTIYHFTTVNITNLLKNWIFNFEHWDSYLRISYTINLPVSIISKKHLYASLQVKYRLIVHNWYNLTWRACLANALLTRLLTIIYIFSLYKFRYNSLKTTGCITWFYTHQKFKQRYNKTKNYLHVKHTQLTNSGIAP